VGLHVDEEQEQVGLHVDKEQEQVGLHVEERSAQTTSERKYLAKQLIKLPFQHLAKYLVIFPFENQFSIPFSISAFSLAFH
jgi:hypothetical protein